MKYSLLTLSILFVFALYGQQTELHSWQDNKFRGTLALLIFPTHSTYFEDYNLSIDYRINKHLSFIGAVGHSSGENRDVLFFANTNQISLGLQLQSIEHKTWAMRPSLQLLYYGFETSEFRNYKGGGLQLEIILEKGFNKFGLGVMGRTNYTMGKYNGFYIPNDQIIRGFSLYSAILHYGINLSYKL